MDVSQSYGTAHMCVYRFMFDGDHLQGTMAVSEVRHSLSALCSCIGISVAIGLLQKLFQIADLESLATYLAFKYCVCRPNTENCILSLVHVTSGCLVLYTLVSDRLLSRLA